MPRIRSLCWVRCFSKHPNCQSCLWRVLVLASLLLLLQLLQFLLLLMLLLLFSLLLRLQKKCRRHNSGSLGCGFRSCCQFFTCWYDSKQRFSCRCSPCFDVSSAAFFCYRQWRWNSAALVATVPVPGTVPGTPVPGNWYGSSSLFYLPPEPIVCCAGVPAGTVLEPKDMRVPGTVPPYQLLSEYSIC